MKPADYKKEHIKELAALLDENGIKYHKGYNDHNEVIGLYLDADALRELESRKNYRAIEFEMLLIQARFN